MLSFTESGSYALNDLGRAVLYTGPFILIAALRLSRFKLVPRRWFPLKLELPIAMGGSDPDSRSYLVRVKGEAYNEVYINRFLYTDFRFILKPPKREEIEVVAHMEDKIYMNNDEPHYLIRTAGSQNKGTVYLLKPRRKGQRFVSDTYPIAALLKPPEDWLDLRHLRVTDLSFVGWGYLRELAEE
jgi:hypothetical protein